MYVTYKYIHICIINCVGAQLLKCENLNMHFRVCWCVVVFTHVSCTREQDDLPDNSQQWKLQWKTR